MLLSDLAETLNRIEATNGRKETLGLLADLFRRDPDDAGILPYLLQGRLGPPYASPNFGMDERRVALALAEATHVPIKTIQARNLELGDLGLVASAFLPARETGLTVRSAYDALLQLARASGAGSNEQKVSLLSALLRQTSALAGRYVVRVVLGRLRLGVADATIEDALSLAVVDSTRLRPEIEHAYALCSDLGLVAQTLVGVGPDALVAIQPRPGRPVLPALAERLPSPAAIVAKLGPSVVEPKYDGVRIQGQRAGDEVWLFTRRLENVTDALPEIAAALREQVDAEQVILDGEAVGYDPGTGRLLPFQETTKRRRKHGVSEAAVAYPLRYYVFDLLSLDGENLMPRPLEERLARLRAILRPEPDGTIQLAPETEVDSAAQLESLLAAAVDDGLEGIMVKRPNAPYHAGTREYHWVKLKPEYAPGMADTFDVVVVGYDLGRGRRARLGIGSLLCCVVDRENGAYRTVTRVGSGLSDADFVRFREQLDAARIADRPANVDSLIVPDVWVEPRYVVEVAAAGITRSPLHTCGKVDDRPGYALRFPRVVRLRADRRPDDATTQAEIIQAYQAQGGTVDRVS